jgi:osmotically-inducible protein OsmY
MRKSIVVFAVIALLAFTGIAMGQAVSDDMIKSQINKSIQASPGLSIGNVMVDSKDGNVTLSGKVANKEAEKQIVDMANKTPGVKSVKSNLQVYQQR